MAKSRKRSSQHRAGSRKRTTTVGRRRRAVANPFRRRVMHRRNPGGGKIMGYVVSGAAVVGGAVGSKAVTQLVLGAKNTGATGYLGNGVATGLLGWLSHMVFRDKSISQMVIAGGIAQILVRFMTDQTPYGSFMASAGIGDYQTNWNFTTPQRVAGYPPNSIIVPPGYGGGAAITPGTTHSAGVGALIGASDWN